jgi:hypothetical protein
MATRALFVCLGAKPSDVIAEVGMDARVKCEIPDVIVESVAVNMMDNLKPAQPSPKVLLHHESVYKNLTATKDSDAPVSPDINAAALVCSTGPAPSNSTATLARAEDSLAFPSLKRFLAARALLRYHSGPPSVRDRCSVPSNTVYVNTHLAAAHWGLRP